jgi:hypothetical protein
MFVIFNLVGDLTAWSLHPFYKRCLCTAFALKRIRPDDLHDDERDRVEAFERDTEPGAERGIALERDFDRLVPLSDTAHPEGAWPTLVVCAAANISDPGATPPGRNVTSFTFSAHSVGGPLVGGAPTKQFEKAMCGRKVDPGWTLSAEERDRRTVRRLRDFSLPGAVAMSGAAISPSMGKLTRRPLRFLLALANIRLGVWVPNPRWVMGTDKKQRKWFGRARPSYLLRELIGRNRVDARYLYVTDGGHYENLGLVELLRRGCNEIYCIDASGGEAFDVLGDAIALARSELGVEIDIAPDRLFPDQKTDIADATAIKGSFRYANGFEGVLIYARNVMVASAPWDVQARHKLDPRFPHNSTADQLYTDQKFEGYRKLGELAGDHAVALMAKARRAAADNAPSSNGAIAAADGGGAVVAGIALAD